MKTDNKKDELDNNELKKILLILNRYDQKRKKHLQEKQENLDSQNSNQENSENNVESFISYEQTLINILKVKDEKIASLKEAELTVIARSQTMARRHVEEEKQNRKYSGSRLAQDILKPIDLFKKIVAMPASSPEVKNYLMGFDLIAKQLDQALNANGIEQIAIKIGDTFNPQLHEATEVIETDEFKPNAIVEIIANGYKLHDRVLIHSLVKVAKEPKIHENENIKEEE